MSHKKSLIAAGVAFVVVAVLGITAGVFAQNRHGDWGPGSMWGGSDGDGHGMMDGDEGYGGRGGMMGDGFNGRGGMMGDGFNGRGGMMGGSFGIAGDGPVSTMGEARAAAQRFADTLDLRVGEVMQFSDNFYAELKKPSGRLATEVLVDPDTGAVRIEYGPAMMWNTEYGMHPVSDPGKVDVSAAEAEKIANEWLADHRSGETAGEAEAFPGYYTLHSMDGGKITGMLSVNAYTGAVWYHTWHGDYVGMSES